MANRNNVLRGQTVELVAKFLNAANELTDPADLKVSLYPPGKNPDDGAIPSDAWVFEATLSSGGSGPQSDPSRTIIRTSQGIYVYSFPVPADSDLGVGFDNWQGEIDQQELNATFDFVIVGGGSIGTTQLYNNNIIYIQLSDLIKAEDGSGLGEDKTFYFTTTYVPLYVGIRRIRLDLGPLISNVIDDTINFAIFEASLSADNNQFVANIVNATYLNFAKTEYVVCLAELTLVRALMGDGDISQKMYKSLGDLSVSRGGMGDALSKKAKSLEDCVARWQVVIQSGGEITPDTSLRPGHSVKGMYAEDAITVNRQWEPTSGVGYMPGANTDEPTVVSRRRIRTFRKRT
jgi:hypothetical protein